MERTKKCGGDDGEKEEFQPLRINFYSTILLVVLSQVSLNFGVVKDAKAGKVENIGIVPSVFNVSTKYEVYVTKGIIVESEEVFLSFGPGFEKILKKQHQIHPNLDEFGQNEKKKLQQDRMIHMSVPELIENGGKKYRWKEHTVITDDHYILTIFQIRKRRECDMTVPVLFMHDFMGSAADWLLVDPKDAIPFAMVDQGYEVWLLNARGNEYSNRHQFYKTSDPRFWRFSFHEQGIYDLPAVIKHVQKHTATQRMEPDVEKRKVSFVGSGMGTTVFYVYLSKLGEDANGNITSFVSVTPTAFMHRTTSPLKLLQPLAKEYLPFQKDGPLIPELLANFLHYALPDLCPFAALRNASLCISAGLLGSTEFSSDISTRVLRRVFGHYPGTTSIRTFLHYVQLVTKPKFTEFNFGLVKNFEKYQQFVPYQYNLFQASVASFNLYAQGDITVDYRDAERTTNDVSVTVHQSNLMVTGPYTHVDFMYGTVGTYMLRSAVLSSTRLTFYHRCKNTLYAYEIQENQRELVEFCCLEVASIQSNEFSTDKCKNILEQAGIIATEARCNTTQHCGCPTQQHPFFYNNFPAA